MLYGWPEVVSALGLLGDLGAGGGDELGVRAARSFEPLDSVTAQLKAMAERLTQP